MAIKTPEMAQEVANVELSVNSQRASQYSEMANHALAIATTDTSLEPNDTKINILNCLAFIRILTLAGVLPSTACQAWIASFSYRNTI